MTTMNNAQRGGLEAAMQRAALHLISQDKPGSHAETDTHIDADYHIEAAVRLCARGNRRDLAERLLAIGAELHRPGSPKALALERLTHDEPAATPSRTARVARKLAKAAPGTRVRRKLVRRGASLVTV